MKKLNKNEKLSLLSLVGATIIGILFLCFIFIAALNFSLLIFLLLVSAFCFGAGWATLILGGIYERFKVNELKK